MILPGQLLIAAGMVSESREIEFQPYGRACFCKSKSSIQPAKIYNVQLVLQDMRKKLNIEISVIRNLLCSR